MGAAISSADREQMGGGESRNADEKSGPVALNPFFTMAGKK
jgi:hypothetical protein